MDSSSLNLVCMEGVIMQFLTLIFGEVDSLSITLIILIFSNLFAKASLIFVYKRNKYLRFIKLLISKVLIIFIVATVVNLDRYLFDNLVLRPAVLCFYITREGLMLCTSADKLGVPIPKKLKEILQTLKIKFK